MSTRVLTNDDYVALGRALGQGYDNWLIAIPAVEFGCWSPFDVAMRYQLPAAITLIQSILDRPRVAEAERLALYLEAEADAGRSGAGLAVSDEAIDFARQRLRAIAGNLRAGLHLPEPILESEAASG